MSDPARLVLIVDDDQAFADTLGRALGRHGFSVQVAYGVKGALAQARAAVPQYAVIDLRLAEESGLSLIEPLRELNPKIHMVVLTGYASIPTAVKAIKKGVHNYLAKPVSTKAVLDALLNEETAEEESEEYDAMSLRRLEWEHIQRVLDEHDGNISATARALKMHRRTLQRKLAKKPVQE